MSEKVFYSVLCNVTIAAAPLYANSICLKDLLMFIYLYAMKLIQRARRARCTTWCICDRFSSL